MSGPFSLKQRLKLAANFSHRFLRQLADELGAPDAPIKTFHLIGENHAIELKSGRDGHFERIVFTWLVIGEKIASPTLPL